jgi:hypothetical protein
MDQRPETLELLEENTGKTPQDLCIDNYFLNRTSQIRNQEELNEIAKLKCFCTAKQTKCRVKREPTEWEKIFASHSSDKELISRILQN